jgi:hypothetical protein
MNTLVEKVRFAVSAENDDFFRDSTIVEYLNRAQDRVISQLIMKETDAKAGRTMRALDNLRYVKDDTSLSENANVDGDDYIEQDVDITSINAKEILYVGFLKAGTDPVRAKELSSQDLMLLNWGNIKPSSYESYYFVKGGDKITLFADNVPASSVLWIHYIKKASEIDSGTTALAELPLQLENAVVYGACEMMAIQEQRENTANFAALYEEEIELNAY